MKKIFIESEYTYRIFPLPTKTVEVVEVRDVFDDKLQTTVKKEVTISKEIDADGVIEVEQSVIDVIGVTHKFDTINYEIIPMTLVEIETKQRDRENYEKQLNFQHQILQLKQQLAEMDYKTSKYADGEYTEFEWAAIVAERKNLRIQIRKLETL